MDTYMATGVQCHVPLNCVTKTDTFGGLYHTYICVFPNPLQIFLPRVEILFVPGPIPAQGHLGH